MDANEIMKELAKKLIDIKPFLEASDRSECVKATGYASITIHRYLNGDVKKAQVAADIYQFMSTRVEKRTQLAKAKA